MMAADKNTAKPSMQRSLNGLIASAVNESLHMIRHVQIRKLVIELLKQQICITYIYWMVRQSRTHRACEKTRNRKNVAVSY
jgi:hypothetical protein